MQEDNFRTSFCLHSETKCFGCFMYAKYVTFLKDANGRYLRVSASFLECFGIEPRRLVNRTASECFDYVIAKELEDGDRAVLQTGKTDTRIIQWSHTDGRSKLWMVKKAVVKDGLILGMAFDITAYLSVHSNQDGRPPMDATHTRMVESSLGSYAA
jgi:PAS domain-containing protein